MTANPKSLRELALEILKKRDSAWDSRGTVDENLSHGQNHAGTANIESQERFNPTVPVSQPLGRGTVGHLENCGTALGTVVGQSPYSTVLAALKSRCPELVEGARWQQAQFGMRNPFSPSGGNTRTPSVGRRASYLASIRCHRCRRPSISVCRAMTPPA